MYEVEHKAPIELETTRARLNELGAIHRDTVEQGDTYFQHPTRDFAESDEALRIRRVRNLDEHESSTVILTYKGPRLEAETKTRKEHETSLGDAESASSIFEALGFEPVATVEKRRERWDLESMTVCLDNVTDLGTFVEIEATVAGADLETANDRAQELLDALEIPTKVTTTKSYLGMLLEDQNGVERSE